MKGHGWHLKLSYALAKKMVVKFKDFAPKFENLASILINSENKLPLAFLILCSLHISERTFT